MNLCWPRSENNRKDWGDVLYALQIPPSLASLSATKFLLQIYMELTDQNKETAAILVFQTNPYGIDCILMQTVFFGLIENACMNTDELVKNALQYTANHTN